MCVCDECHPLCDVQCRHREKERGYGPFFSITTKLFWSQTCARPEWCLSLLRRHVDQNFMVTKWRIATKIMSAYASASSLLFTWSRFCGHIINFFCSMLQSQTQKNQRWNASMLHACFVTFTVLPMISPRFCNWTDLGVQHHQSAEYEINRGTSPFILWFVV